MAGALWTIAFTQGFLTQARAEGMEEDDLTRLADILAANPEQGEPLAGGVHKMRFARKGQGKSGSWRVIILYVDEDVPVYCLAVLAKGTRANFTDKELEAFATVAKAIRRAYRKKG